MRLLVTGGCGLIGSAIVERALRDGWEVSVLDNLSTGRREHLPAHPDVELTVGDVCDDATVAALVRRCDRVAHLAAGVGVALVLDRPTGALRQSLLGTEIVLRHAAAHRRPLFFASTSEVYGESDGTPLSEERAVGFGSPERTRFSYAAGKAAGEALAFAYAGEYGLPVVVGRFFNVTGARQSADAGVFPRLLSQAQAGGPLTVHGDGEQTRSFLDADDAAEIVWRLLDRAGPAGALCNIGRDERVTMRALAERIRTRVDPTLEIVHTDPQYGSGFAPIRHRRPDCTRLKALTEFEPRYDLDAILDRALRYEERTHAR
ncbi:MAG: NAD-dependent epimerase/dehydratase family protein [Planctomycetota bacterium]|jgi:UDP-glucose 4-epimerase